MLWRFAPALWLLVLPGCAAIDKPTTLSGPYGGPHIGLLLQGGLGDVQLDCAAGTIDEPIPNGKNLPFRVTGTYRAGSSGPVRVGQIFVSQKATYSGTVVKEDELVVSVALEDGTALGPFTLHLGAPAEVERCL